MALLDQVSSAQSKDELSQVIEQNEQLTQAELDTLKAELDSKVWDTKDQLRDFMNDIYYKIINSDHTYKEETEQDLEALKTLAKIQIYGNQHLDTHTDTDPDLIWWKRTTATIREIYKEKTWKDPKAEVYEEKNDISKLIEDNSKIIQNTTKELIEKRNREKDKIIIWWKEYPIKDGKYIVIDDELYQRCNNDKEFIWKWFIEDIDGSGSLYIWDVTEGQAEGIWAIYYKNWDIYEWHIENNKVTWRWKMTWQDKSYYDGDRNNGKMEESWSYTNIHGIKIQWFFKNNKYVWKWLLSRKKIKWDREYMNNIIDQSKIDNPWRFK